MVVPGIAFVYDLTFELTVWIEGMVISNNSESLILKEAVPEPELILEIKRMVTLPSASVIPGIEEKVEKEDKRVPLIKYPNGIDHFTFRSTQDLTIQKDENLVKTYSSKSFHTDRYCFDSKPEEQLFLDLIADKNVDKIYFTGMFTGKENGLSVQYIDPESNMIRTYYPDFLVYYKDGSIDIIEVKGDNMIDSKEVQAKAEAMLETALYSDKMDYKIIKSSDIMHNRYKDGEKIKRPEELFIEGR